MGRPRPNSNQTIQHFSHPHPLEFFNLQQQNYTFNLPPCAMCKLQPSGMVCICKTCNFILHLPCSQRPQFIHHSSDPSHPLTLLPFPAYPDRTFICNACGLLDNGFSYHCRVCSLDLHIHCASMPMTLNHQSHPHTLSLSTRSPSPGAYICSICCGIVVNQWTYDCLPCDFGDHLSCFSNPYARATYMGNPYTQATYMDAAPTYTGGNDNSLMVEAAKGLVQVFTGSSSDGTGGSTSSVIGTITSSVLQSMLGLN
ncbi:hypothetical protein NE237_021840 [Protea cynaroides]|uniref:DC1 domain-containing protein n=1 Tax=Protea cynaroides TaxID=273540 RepID=A0A9Q0HC26_9MAGN|nr:hypothetical protein NE237_021840 [Protea cynaroides]